MVKHGTWLSQAAWFQIVGVSFNSQMTLSKLCKTYCASVFSSSKRYSNNLLPGKIFVNLSKHQHLEIMINIVKPVFFF